MLLSRLAFAATFSAPVPSAPLLPSNRPPPARFRPPPKVLAPLSVNTVAPFFARPPSPDTTPPSVMFWLPGSVRIAPAPKATLLLRFSATAASSDTLPPMFSAPVPAAALLPSSTLPALRLRPPLKPLVPFKVNSEAPFLVRLPTPEMSPVRVMLLLPPRVSAAPRLTALPRVSAELPSNVAAPLTLSAPVPSAPLLPSSRPPALSATPPVKVFAPVNVCTPLPFFTRPPPTPLITPAKTWSVTLPKVSVLPPNATVEPATPDSAPMVWLPPRERSSAAPAPDRLTAPVAARLPPLPSATVPAATFKPPVKVLAPLSVSVEAPLFIRPPPPEIAPPSVSALPPSTFNEPAAPMITSLPRVRAEVVSSVAALLISSRPVPSALLLPSSRPPPLTTRPPLNVLVPFNVSSDAPFLPMLPTPEITPFNTTGWPPCSASEPPAPSAMSLARVSAAVVPSSVTSPPTLSTPVPNAPLLPSSRPPPFRAKPPVKLLLPDSVCTPVPTLTRPPVVPVKLPAKEVLPRPPRVSVRVPRLTVPPSPDSEPTVWLAAAVRSSDVPAVSEIAAVGDRLPPAPSANEPSAIETLPVSVFAPPRVSVPAPFFTRLPAPDSAPFNVNALVPTRFRLPPPLTTMLLARLKAPLVSSDALPPTVSAPPPRAPALPSSKPPALRFTPPPNRFAPPSVTTPVLVTVRPPAPDSTPFKPKLWLPPRVRPALRAKLLPRDRPAPLAAIAPPLTVNNPEPKDVLLSKFTRPPPRVIAPVPDHGPCRFQVPPLTASFWKPR